MTLFMSFTLGYISICAQPQSIHLNSRPIEKGFHYRPNQVGCCQTGFRSNDVYGLGSVRGKPEEKRFVQREFKTGGYQSGDKDDRIWAAAEMWETTGDTEYLKDFEAQAKTMNFEIDENWDWGDVSNLGMFQYALSKKSGKNPEILEAIRNNIIVIANTIVKNANADVYGHPLKKDRIPMKSCLSRFILQKQLLLILWRQQ